MEALYDPSRRVRHLEAVGAPQGAVCVLEEDAELGKDVPAESASLAARAAIAPLQVLERGRWHPTPRQDAGMFGLLVLSGSLIARTHLMDYAAVEVVGPSDVVRPWMPNTSETLVTKVEWSVLEPARIAVLDRGFGRRIARWPEITATLMARQAVRARGLDVLLALRAIPRIEHRVLLLLWSLADRFGKVGRSGIRLELPLTHQLLAELVAARRPTVTTALGSLHEQGLLQALHGPRGWLLTGAPPDALPRLSHGARNGH